VKIDSHNQFELLNITDNLELLSSAMRNSCGFQTPTLFDTNL